MSSAQERIAEVNSRTVNVPLNHQELLILCNILKPFRYQDSALLSLYDKLTQEGRKWYSN